MSHNTDVTGLSIHSKDMVVAAVADLQAQGVNIELLENVKPRMYYSHQHPNAADIVLKLKDSSYDVALNWNDQTEEYDIVFDEWNDEIRKAIGISAKKSWSKSDKQLSTISRFIQSHSVATIESEAKQKGYKIGVGEKDDDGNTIFTLNTAKNQYNIG